MNKKIPKRNQCNSGISENPKRTNSTDAECLILAAMAYDRYAAIYTHINELLLFALCGTIQMSTFMVILISYFYILITVLSIKSSGGRSKTFSTCASHLIAVTLFYGTLLFMYLRPTTRYSPDTDKIEVFCMTGRLASYVET
ncbi:hypothetical protein STEG23_012702 [Scotinomys teguina]